MFCITSPRLDAKQVIRDKSVTNSDHSVSSSCSSKCSVQQFITPYSRSSHDCVTSPVKCVLISWLFICWHTAVFAAWRLHTLCSNTCIWTPDEQQRL